MSGNANKPFHLINMAGLIDITTQQLWAIHCPFPPSCCWLFIINDKREREHFLTYLFPPSSAEHIN